MGIVLEKLEDGAMGKDDIAALLKEDDPQFVDRVISELRARKLVNVRKGRLFKKRSIK